MKLIGLIFIVIGSFEAAFATPIVPAIGDTWDTRLTDYENSNSNGIYTFTVVNFNGSKISYVYNEDNDPALESDTIFNFTSRFYNGGLSITTICANQAGHFDSVTISNVTVPVCEYSTNDSQWTIVTQVSDVIPGGIVSQIYYDIHTGQPRIERKIVSFNRY